MDERSLVRFKRKIMVLPNECWYWLGNVSDDGYAMFHFQGQNRPAHRVSHMHFVGPIPEGFHVDHLCHTWEPWCPGGAGDHHRRCVQWRHLEAVTPLENTLRGVRAPGTHCVNGHELTPENTYYAPRGGRACRACRHEQSVARLAIYHPGVRHGTETHCPQGHPYSGSNLIITVNGGRACRICKRDWNRSYARIKRAVGRGYILLVTGTLVCPFGHDLTRTAFPYQKQEACLACVGAPEPDGRSREIKAGAILEAAAPVLLGDGPDGMLF